MPEQAETEADQVEAWRLHVLIQAGWEPYRAELLAKNHGVDWRVAVRMIEAGCDQRVALDILL